MVCTHTELCACTSPPIYTYNVAMHRQLTRGSHALFIALVSHCLPFSTRPAEPSTEAGTGCCMKLLTHFLLFYSRGERFCRVRKPVSARPVMRAISKKINFCDMSLFKLCNAEFLRQTLTPHFNCTPWRTVCHRRLITLFTPVKHPCCELGSSQHLHSNFTKFSCYKCRTPQQKPHDSKFHHSVAPYT